MDTQCSRFYNYEISPVKRNGLHTQKLIFIMLIAILKNASSPKQNQKDNLQK